MSTWLLGFFVELMVTHCNILCQRFPNEGIIQFRVCIYGIKKPPFREAMSCIFIILLRFILGGDGIIYYAAAGANLGAGAAAGALFGIDTGIAVFNGDGAVFAFLHAASAAYARLHAGGAGNAAYVLIAAEHKDLRLRGDYPYGAAGAGLFAVAAGNANIGVYAGDAVVHAY